MELSCRQVGPWLLNTYCLVCSDTRCSVLIDPGAEPDILRKMLYGTRPVAVVITHGHSDHIGALDDVRTHLGVPVMAHPGDSDNPSPVPADRWLDEGDEIQIGQYRLRVYHSPGHTADQICLEVQGDDTFIVGDTIFKGGPGRTWSLLGFEQTLRTLRETVLRWPDDAICHPGHGPHFRLGDQRRAIEEFLGKDHGDFFGDAFWEM